jgi:hypothetical protein
MFILTVCNPNVAKGRLLAHACAVSKYLASGRGLVFDASTPSDLSMV